MERPTTTAEEVQEDIDINTKEGLQAFSRYTEDTYSELIEQVKSHSSESSHQLLENASRLYETLKEKLDTAFSLKDEGGDVDETLAEEIQTHYNELLDILDGLEHEVVAVEVAPDEATSTDVEVVDVAPEPEEPVPNIEPEAPVQVSEIKIETPDEDNLNVEVAEVPEVVESTQMVRVMSETKTEDVVEESETAKKKEEPEAPALAPEKETEIEAETEKEESVDEGVVVENSKLTPLQEKAEALVASAEALLAKYQEITEVVSSDAVLNVGQHYYKQLGLTAERARAVLKNITGHFDKEDKVTELVAEHLEDTVDEISDNLEQLNKGLGGFFEKDEVSLLETDTKKTGAIEVAKEEAGETVVPITLVKKPEPVVAKPTPQTAIHNAPIRPSVERVEKVFRGEWGGTIEKVIKIPRYSKFVSYTFPSPAQFEAMLRREIQRIEAPSKFDSAFGFTYKSAFHDLLRSMSVKEVVEFDGQPRDVIRAELQEADIKYEVYLDWIDSLNSMLNITHAHPTMTFGELFVRAELETLLQHDEQVAA